MGIGVTLGAVGRPLVEGDTLHSVAREPCDTVATSSGAGRVRGAEIFPEDAILWIGGTQDAVPDVAGVAGTLLDVAVAEGIRMAEGRVGHAVVGELIPRIELAGRTEYLLRAAGIAVSFEAVLTATGAGRQVADGEFVAPGPIVGRASEMATCLPRPSKKTHIARCPSLCGISGCCPTGSFRTSTPSSVTVSGTYDPFRRTSEGVALKGAGEEVLVGVCCVEVTYSKGGRVG